VTPHHVRFQLSGTQIGRAAAARNPVVEYGGGRAVPCGGEGATILPVSGYHRRCPELGFRDCQGEGDIEEVWRG
jgi:hypothetical protein